MEDFPADLQDLAQALKDPASSDWWVGSAEGGWQLPSKAEWGAATEKPAEQTTGTSSDDTAS